jgi:four helix bundle protein
METGHSSYKDLIVWQKSMAFANDVIALIEEIESPRKHFRLFEQLESAATSIPMNIAEGKGRNYRKEFVQYLYIARGSLYETLTLLEIFSMRNWVDKEKFIDLENKSNEIAKLLKGLINSLHHG